ncbi:MAG: hypothetical protein KKH28_06405 [Elusimicrobia bacterium]|nr:hypothetical protein [Elusimicrobiota bacterium]
MTAFFILGFFSLTVQVLILKELSGLLAAHEIALGLGISAWLLWTAAGIASASGRRRLKNILLGPGGQLKAYGLLAFGAALNFILIKKTGMFLKAGLMPGLFELLILSALLTLPAALANGICIFQGLFKNTLSFYWAETLGAAAGGLFTLFYAQRFPNADPVIITGVLALALIISAHDARALGFKKILFATAAGVLFFSAARMNPPFALPGFFSGAGIFQRTTGSRLALIAGTSQQTFIEDGAILAQFPDPETQEKRAQPALLAHKKPDSVLFLGAGGFFLAGEARKHSPKEITIAEADRFKTAFILKHTGVSAQGLKIINSDARDALKANLNAYDLIFQTVPEPLNANANRSFTLEFFRASRAALKPGGILAFSLPFSENYLPPVRAYFAASILATAGAVFKYVECVPGGVLTVLAFDSPIDLSVETLRKRYLSRKIKNTHVVPESLPFLLDPYRKQWALAMLKKIKPPPLNTDLNPSAYFYLWKLWLSMFVSPKALTGLCAVGILSALLFTRLLKPRALLKDKPAAGVFLTGFWAMGFEVVILLMFQTASGQLNWKLGLLFAGFMAGAAAGAFLFKRIKNRYSLAALPGLALALSAGLYRAAPGLAELKPDALFALFMSMLFAGGFVMGGYFAAAVPHSAENPERLYAADLLGAALGAFAFSGALIPLCGMQNALLAAIGVLIPCFFFWKTAP